MLTNLEIVKWKESKYRIIEIEKMVELDLIHKFRIKWISDGAENSRFFHNSIKIKNKQNNLHGLMVNGIWITDVNTIK